MTLLPFPSMKIVNENSIVIPKQVIKGNFTRYGNFPRRHFSVGGKSSRGINSACGIKESAWLSIWRGRIEEVPISAAVATSKS